jgi:hypothetical protein
MGDWFVQDDVLRKDIFKYGKDRCVFLIYSPKNNSASVNIEYIVYNTPRTSFLYGYTFDAVTNKIQRIDKHMSEDDDDDDESLYPLDTHLCGDKSLTNKRKWFIADSFISSLFSWIDGDTAKILYHTVKFQKYPLFIHRNNKNRFFWVMLNDEIIKSLYDIFIENNKENCNAV